MTKLVYFGQTTTKRGDPRFITGTYEGREQAAAAALAGDPSAKSCSTARMWVDDDHDGRAPRSGCGGDIRWHRRDEIADRLPDVAEPMAERPFAVQDYAGGRWWTVRTFNTRTDAETWLGKPRRGSRVIKVGAAK